MAYDPDLEEKKIDFYKHVASKRTIERKDDTDLLHGEEGGMIFKYDLPVVNMPITFHNKLIKLLDAVQPVPNKIPKAGTAAEERQRRADFQGRRLRVGPASGRCGAGRTDAALNLSAN